MDGLITCRTEKRERERKMERDTAERSERETIVNFRERRKKTGIERERDSELTRSNQRDGKHLIIYFTSFSRNTCTGLTNWVLSEKGKIWDSYVSCSNTGNGYFTQPTFIWHTRGARSQWEGPFTNTSHLHALYYTVNWSWPRSISGPRFAYSNYFYVHINNLSLH